MEISVRYLQTLTETGIDIQKTDARVIKKLRCVSVDLDYTKRSEVSATKSAYRNSKKLQKPQNKVNLREEFTPFLDRNNAFRTEKRFSISAN